MKIPLANTLYGGKNSVLNTKKIDTKVLSKLNFRDASIKDFPALKLINKSFNIKGLKLIAIHHARHVLKEFWCRFPIMAGMGLQSILKPGFAQIQSVDFICA